MYIKVRTPISLSKPDWARFDFLLCGALYTSSTTNLLPSQHCWCPLYTWVKRSNYDKVSYSWTQQVDRNKAQTHNFEPSTDSLDYTCPLHMPNA